MRLTGMGVARMREVRRSSPPERVGEVERVVDASFPFRKVSWQSRAEPTVVELANGTRIGGREVVVAAGPCSPKGDERIIAIAHGLRAAGATVLHAGVFRPHGGPYSGAGRGEGALEVLRRVREETGMAVMAEALDLESARLLAACVDVLRIGPGNMQNFPLLRHAARLGKPMVLVRGHAATIAELLMAAEYVLAEGNGDAILCEAGVMGLTSDGHRVLDLTAVPVVQSLSHLPVMAAPGCLGDASVAAMSRAATAAGADGLIVEIQSPPAGDDHPDGFARLMEQVGSVARAMGRGLAPPLARERALGAG